MKTIQTDKERFIKQTNQTKRKKIVKQDKGAGTIKVDIEKAKQKVQYTTHSYIVGLKFVTTETADEVLRGIKRDLDIYPNIARFVVKGNLIKIGLKTNATPCAYYFMNQKVFDEVVSELPKFDIPIDKV